MEEGIVGMLTFRNDVGACHTLTAVRKTFQSLIYNPKPIA